MNQDNAATRALAYLEIYLPDENSIIVDLLDSLHIIEFIEIVEETLGMILTTDEINTFINLSVGEIPQYLRDLMKRS
jgi:hypothetical protein